MVDILTYLSNDNTDEVYRVESANSVTNEKMLNGILESNRGGLFANNRLGVFSSGISTSGSLAKSISIDALIWRLARHAFMISTETAQGGIIRKFASGKHYIVYPEKIRGKKDLDTFMRCKTRVWRWGHLELLAYS